MLNIIIKNNYQQLHSLKIVNEIIECNPKTLVSTEGEPLIRHDFLYILKYIKNNFHN